MSGYAIHSKSKINNLNNIWRVDTDVHMSVTGPQFILMVFSSLWNMHFISLRPDGRLLSFPDFIKSRLQKFINGRIKSHGNMLNLNLPFAVENV